MNSTNVGLLGDNLDDRLREFEPVIRGLARERHLAGGDYQDLRQEGRVALLLACRDWRPQHGPFRPFAVLVISRRIDTAVKLGSRLKHRVLTDATRVLRDPDGELVPALDVCADRGQDPHEILMVREELRRVRRGCRLLAGLERDALAYLLDHGGYGSQVGGLAGYRTVEWKRFENAVYRARAKLRQAA